MRNRSVISLALVAGAALAVSACIPRGGPVGNAAVPQPAKAVSLGAYLGPWYEYGRYENSFEKDCEAVTANYARRSDGLIRVTNTCRQGSVDGKVKQSVGKAKIVEDSADAKLKVSFFGPFYGDYWVLDRGEPGPDGLYPWSIVGEPSGRYLWLLTRAQRPDEATRALLERRARELGYDWSLVRLTRH
ncbi:lipocalin family protein [Parablastomonas sp. CN1-191]|uniref:lipocalin family protein n=1 Tax=Parablastomonas sp. CN1-191 TaxID=3400908 RepID=UPI003BF7AC0C